MLRQPSLVFHNSLARARAAACLCPAVTSYAYTSTFVSTNCRLPLMQIVSRPRRIAIGAKVYALAQHRQAAFSGAVIAGLTLDGLPEYTGEELRHGSAAAGPQHAGLP